MTQRTVSSSQPIQYPSNWIVRKGERTFPLGKLNIFQKVIAFAIIWSVLLPVMVLDFWIWVYQSIYFRIMHIPIVPRKEYIVFDRHQLQQLNWMQRLNCLYCSYVNGSLAWMKAVANQTELYSCAIKHRIVAKGQDHQQDFYEYGNFDKPKK